MSLPEWASAWLELSLQDWAAILGIIVGIFATVSRLAKIPGWFRRRIDAPPVTAEFDFTGDGIVDADGDRWVMMWLQNTGARVYVHDVRWKEGEFLDFPEKEPRVAKVGEIGSIPRELRSLSKRELQHKEGVFKPQYFSGKKRILFYVFSPGGCDGDAVRYDEYRAVRGPATCI